MIDYEKLKEAHGLINGIDNASMSIHFYFDERCILYGSLEEIDDLLIKLNKITELYKPKPKYKIGQEVWLFSGAFNNCKKYVINDIYWCHELKDFRFGLVSDLGMADVTQSSLYVSKEAIIEEQIKYWSELLDEECAKSTLNDSSDSSKKSINNKSNIKVTSLADLDMLDKFGIDDR